MNGAAIDPRFAVFDFAVCFEWGIVYGPEHEAFSYGRKHANRFGRYLSSRPADETDPVNPYRITYQLNEHSPARQRYLKRRHDRRHKNQPVLFPDMFAPLPLTAAATVARIRQFEQVLEAAR